MRVFIIDDHVVYREGLKSVLAAQPDFEVVGEAAAARAAFPDVDKQRPDLVVLDLILPGMDGCSAARELARRLPQARVAVLTACEAVQDLLDTQDAGVLGYVLKSETTEAVVAALRRVGKGQSYVTPSLAPICQRASRAGTARTALGLLSEREREVFRLAIDGLVTAEIARELCISRKTVETHKYRIQRKFGLRSTTDLVRFAALQGLIRMPRGQREAEMVTVPTEEMAAVPS